jgi:hypothetical protein
MMVIVKKMKWTLEEDIDFSVKNRYKKNYKVVIELPRDILNSPEVCAMLDRTGTTSRKAVGVVGVEWRMRPS